MNFLRFFILSLIFLFFISCGSSNNSKAELNFSSAFITTWKVSKADKSITIPTKGGGYDYVVDWGDGDVEANLKANATHIYEKEGTYTVKIIGKFPRIYFQSTPSEYGFGNALKLLSVKQWGDNKWSSMNGAFYTCKNMIINTTDNPDLLEVEDMSYMFYNYSSIEEDIDRDKAVFHTDISGWDVSNVKDMSFMFAGSSFNQNIGSWDVSLVTNMSSMFIYTDKFNQDISSWNVSSVTNMNKMFTCSRSFNQALGTWDISSVTNMNKMFASTYDGNSKNKYCNTSLSTINYDNMLNGWSKLELQKNVKFDVGDTQYLNSASKNREKISSKFNWNIKDGGKVNVVNSNYSSTFREGDTLTFLASEIIPHDERDATYRWEEKGILLSNDNNFTTNTLSIGEHNITLTVTNNKGILDRDLITIVISNTPFVQDITFKPFITKWYVFDVLEITTFSGYEYNYDIDWGDGFKDYNLTGNSKHTYKEESGSYTVKIFGKFPGFYNTNKDFAADQIEFSLSAVEQWGNIEWRSMFLTFEYMNLSYITAVDIPNLSKTTSCAYMFSYTGRNSSSTLNFNTWDFSNIETMEGMFLNSRVNQPISSWDTHNVVNMSKMFYGAITFNHGIYGLNFSNVKTMKGMFQGARSFNQNISSWDVSNVTNMDEMFSTSYIYFNGEEDIEDETTSSFNQNLGDWNISNVTTMREMFKGVTLSTENYDKILIGWSKLELQKNVVFDGGDSQYSSNAKEARDRLMNDFNWTITDGGMEK